MNANQISKVVPKVGNRVLIYLKDGTIKDGYRDQDGLWVLLAFMHVRGLISRGQYMKVQ